MHTIERYHDISCGHRVVGHEGACARLHGHNYRITFVCAATDMVDVTTLEDNARRYAGAQLDDVGRVVDFSVIKERLCQWLEDHWDHKTLLWTSDQAMLGMLATYSHESKNYEGHVVFNNSFVWVPFNPTAENMAQHLVEVVAPAQLEGTDVRVIACKVEETRKCSATYYVED